MGLTNTNLKPNFWKFQDVFLITRKACG